MASFADFVAMGGHGGYVWSAYGLAVAVIGGLILASRSALKAREAEVAALEAGRPSRRARRRAGSSADSSTDSSDDS